MGKFDLYSKETESKLYLVVFFLFAALMASTIYATAYEVFVIDEITAQTPIVRSVRY